MDASSPVAKILILMTPASAAPAGFLRQLISIGRGTLFAQAAVVATSPLLTRLYAPDDFGAFGLLIAFVSVAAVAVTLRLDVAIPSAASDRQADALLALNLAVVVPCSLVAGAFLAALAYGGIAGYGQLPVWSGLIVAALLVATGTFSALRFWHVRRMQFAQIGEALARQGLARAVVPLGLGLLPLAWAGLALGELVGRVFGLARLGRGAWRPALAAVRDSRSAFLPALLRRNRRYPTVLLASSVVDALAAAVPLPLIASAFGLAAAGEYALITRIASAPAALIGNSLADVVHARFARDRGAAVPELRQVAGRFALVGLALYLPAALAAPILLPWIFGPDWHRSGYVFACLAPALLAALLVSPFSRVLVVADRPELKLIVDMLFLTLPVTGLWLARDLGYLPALVVFAALNCAVFAVYAALIWRIARAAR